MKNGFEELFGKALLVGVFSVLAAMQIGAIVMIVKTSSGSDYWEITVVSKSFVLIFLLMTVVLTVTRLPPKDSVAGIEPRLTAIAGTFILMALAFLPPGNIGVGLRLLATLFIVAGTLLSIFCLHWLGRSFSVMATARRLVVQGPYAIVRHPLYAAEAVTAIGVVISNWSIAAVAIGAVWCMLQYRRSVHEEAVLRAAFPDYDGYARLVPRFIPIPF